MVKMRIKVVVTAAVLLGAIGYLAVAGMKTGWVYYMDVAKFVDNGQFYAQRVRLHGTVAKDGFTSSAATMTAHFSLTAKDKSLPVVYRGPIPDLFEAGKDVVVEGKMDNGEFRADVLMTKCASKYEAKKAEHKS